MTFKIVAPDIWHKDAVGNYCLDLARLLSENRYSVKLYAQNFSKEETPEVKGMEKFFEDINDEDIVFLSYTIYDLYLDEILSLSNKKICYFHGVTPPELLEEFEPITAELCRKSQEQFPLLAQFDLLIANSEFITDDLRRYVGVDKSIMVVPPVFNTRFLFQEECSEKKADSSSLNILYVGRVVPHKKVEDAIVVLSELQNYFTTVTLTVVGDTPNALYQQSLEEKVLSLELPDDSVVFTGKVDDRQLYEYYCTSDLFITMSEHEGFGIPVLEAIYFGMPVVLKGGNAAEEVAGEFGLVVDDIENKKMIKNIVKLMKDDARKLYYKENGSAYVKKLLSGNNIGFWLKNIVTLMR